MAEKHILIICGEASGDLNAAHLAQKILEINPKIRISAVGGEFLRKTGAEIYSDIKDFAVIGLFDVLKKLPVFFKLQKFILQKIKAERLDAVILVDFSGFNLRLAKKINHSAPVIYYISPQVWASRQGRIETIRKYIDKMIVIFKFEEEFYKKFGINVDFVGHPLLDIVRPSMERKTKTTLALLPGSRKSEIRHILPIMLEAARLIAQKIKDTQFVVAKSPNVETDTYNSIIQQYQAHLNLSVIEGKAYDCLNSANFALVASGTATLETTIMQVPFAIIYKMNLLNYLLYRPQIKVPYIGMVNIVAGEKIVPEFVQFAATPKKISKEVLRILNNPAELENIKNNLAKVKASLGQTGASLRAAQIIVNFLNK